MSHQSITKTDLMQFTGSQQWYRHGLVRKVLYTEGVQYIAEHAHAYWLIDEIAFGQCVPAIAAQEFQHWKLTVDLERKSAVLTCEDGDDNIVARKKIEYTDFPLDESGSISSTTPSCCQANIKGKARLTRGLFSRRRFLYTSPCKDSRSLCCFFPINLGG